MEDGGGGWWRMDEGRSHFKKEFPVTESFRQFYFSSFSKFIRRVVWVGGLGGWFGGGRGGERLYLI